VNNVTRKLRASVLDHKIFSAFTLLIAGGLMLNATFGWQGMGFPKKSELMYSKGTLESLTTGLHKSRRSYVALRSPERASQKIVYGCTYSAYDSGFASCVGERTLKPYLGKQATVGWYYQPQFLGFQNNTPQLVSLEVEGKYLKTYEDRLKINTIKNRINILMVFFWLALMSPVIIIGARVK
jgi:hypothetical protein